MEAYRYEGDGVDAVGAHCAGAGGVQSRSVADAPREKVSTGAFETWEKRGYWGNVLVWKELGTPRKIRSRANDECVGGLVDRWMARTPSAQALGLSSGHFLNQELQTTATRNRPSPCHRAPMGASRSPPSLWILLVTG